MLAPLDMTAIRIGNQYDLNNQQCSAIHHTLWRLYLLSILLPLTARSYPLWCQGRWQESNVVTGTSDEALRKLVLLAPRKAPRSMSKLIVQNQVATTTANSGVAMPPTTTGLNQVCSFHNHCNLKPRLLSLLHILPASSRQSYNKQPHTQVLRYDGQTADRLGNKQSCRAQVPNENSKEFLSSLECFLDSTSSLHPCI